MVQIHLPVAVDLRAESLRRAIAEIIHDDNPSIAVTAVDDDFKPTLPQKAKFEIALKQRSLLGEDENLPGETVAEIVKSIACG